MKIQSSDHIDQMPEWIDQEPLPRVIEENNIGYDERAARLGRLERRRIDPDVGENINIVRFRI
jgi:hypothetical protein